MSDERRFVCVKGHVVGDVRSDSPNAPTGVCPVSGLRVYVTEVKNPP